MRAGKSPLQQVARRLIERAVDDNELEASDNAAVIERKQMKVIIRVLERNFILCNHRFEDQWFLANDKIYKMLEAGIVNNQIYIEAIALREQTSCFDFPFKSVLINIYVANVDNVLENTKTKINIKDIQCKFILIKENPADEKKYVFVPVLHTEH